MNLVVEHIGKVRKAAVSLDGITVVAGQNGSGKSTMGRVLMTMCALLRRLPSRISNERLKSARESVDGILKSHDLPEMASDFLRDDDSFRKFLKLESWEDSKTLEEQLQQERSRYFFEDERTPQSDAEKIWAIKDEIIEALKKVQDCDSSYYLPTIVGDSFETALGKDFTSAVMAQKRCFAQFVIDENNEAHVQFVDNKFTDDCKIAPSDKIPLAFYFEPIHMLDWYTGGWYTGGSFFSRRWRISANARYKAPDADWRAFLFEDVDKSEWSVERKREHEKIEETLDGLLTVMHGHLEKQDRELRFRDEDVHAPIPVMNVASGIKTMSVLEKGIRAGVIRPGCLLIIDEPESNLHPKWQIEFAHFLVKLHAKFKMRLLLNTHSPFFLKAIEVFSREEQNCGERTHYYYMESDNDGVEYSTKELKDGTNEIFKDYFDAMNDLMSR